MSKLKKWIISFWAGFKNVAGKQAIVVTEEIQKNLKNGSIKTIAEIVQVIIPVTGKIPAEVVKVLEKSIPKILAAQLILRDLPDNPTMEDLITFQNAVLKAFGELENRSMLWSTIGAEIYSSIKIHLEDKKYTFAECVIDVEKAWKLYQSELKKIQK